MKKFTNILLTLSLLFSLNAEAFYFIVKDSNSQVVGVYKSDPGAAPAAHTKYNETTSINLVGWNSSNSIIRSGVNVYVSSSNPFQSKSFAIDDSSDSKIWVERVLGTRFDFSTAFTVLVPFKANWVTGPATNYLIDLKGAFYIQLDQAGARISSRHFDASSNEQIFNTSFTTLVDGEWVWIGITYDGAGGYQLIINGTIYAHAGTKVLVDSTNTFHLGERFGYSVSQDSSMGNFLVLNRVMTPAELTEYYNGGIAVDAHNVFNTSDIIHYYCADNFIGQTSVPDIGGVAATMRSGIVKNTLLTTTDVPN